MLNATKDTTNHIWQITENIGQPSPSAAASKTIKLKTAGTYVDEDIWVTATSDALDEAVLAASGTASATITVQPAGVSVANKSASVSGKTQITAAPSTATTSIDKYYIAVNGTATANTTGATGDISGTATASTTTSGWATKDVTSATVSITGTATAKTSAKTGSTYYIPIASGSFKNSTFNSASASGSDLSGYAENTSVTIPSQGSLVLEAGYYPKTFITLDQLLDGKADTAGIGAADIRQNQIAYDVDGKKLTGTMSNAVIKSGTVSHTLGTPTYNTTDSKFDLSCTISGAAPTVTTAGYISASDGTKNAASDVTETHKLDKIAGSVSISGTKTVKPVISRSTLSITGVTDAASGNATTTAPTSGVYVKVGTAATTTNVTASANINDDGAGYGTKDNHGISSSGNVAVGASASDATYVPIKTTSAASKTNPTASASGNITLGTVTTTKPTSGYYVQADATKGTTTVATAGWIAAGDTDTNKATTRYYPINTAALTHANTATETTATATLKKTAGTVTAASSGSYYITIGKDGQTAGSVKHTASVSEGYVPTAGLSSEATISTSANVTAKTFYFASTQITGSVSGTITSPTGTTYANPALYDNTTDVGDAPYIDLSGNGSATAGSVYNGTATAGHKYMKVYTGSYETA